MKKSSESAISVRYQKIIKQKLDNLKGLDPIVSTKDRPIDDDGFYSKLTAYEKISEMLAYALTADQIKFYLYDFTSADNKSLTEDEQELQTEIKKRIILAILASVLIVASITIPILFTNLNIFALLSISMVAFILSVTILITTQIQSAINNQIDNNSAIELNNALAAASFAEDYQEFIVPKADADSINKLTKELINQLINQPSNPQLIKKIFDAGRSTDIIDEFLKFVDEQKLSEEFEKLDQNVQLEIFIHNPIAIDNFDKLDSMYPALSTAIENNNEALTDIIKNLDDYMAIKLKEICSKYEEEAGNEINNKVSDSINNVRNTSDGVSDLRR